MLFHFSLCFRMLYDVCIHVLCMLNLKFLSQSQGLKSRPLKTVKTYSHVQFSGRFFY